MESNKSSEKASKIIGTIGYLLTSLCIGVFYCLAVVSVFLALADRDWFCLVGLLGSAVVIWILKAVREAIR
jgi:hypothetical protein